MGRYYNWPTLITDLAIPGAVVYLILKRSNYIWFLLLVLLISVVFSVIRHKLRDGRWRTPNG